MWRIVNHTGDIYQTRDVQALSGTKEDLMLVGR
jgi:hypothetical protein